MLYSVAFAVLVTLLPRSALANSPFAACVSSPPVDAVTPPGGLANSFDCAAACNDFLGANVDGSYYLGPASGPGISCQCSQAPPSISTYQAGNEGTCFDALPTSNYEARITQTSFDVIQGGSSCYDRPVPLVGPVTNVNNAEQCFSDCVAYNYAYIGTGQNVNPTFTYTCFCSNTAPTTPDTCPDFTTGTPSNIAHTYYHRQGQRFGGASNRVRRELRERLLAERGRVKALCPDRLTACNTDEFASGFECIDTRSELQSCGGCVYGEFNAANNDVGVDCTAAPGTKRGASTCIEGQCVAYACNSGFTLLNGNCIA